MNDLHPACVLHIRETRRNDTNKKAVPAGSRRKRAKSLYFNKLRGFVRFLFAGLSSETPKIHENTPVSQRRHSFNL